MSPQFRESPETAKDQVSDDCASKDSRDTNNAQSRIPVANLEYRCFNFASPFFEPMTNAFGRQFRRSFPLSQWQADGLIRWCCTSSLRRWALSNYGPSVSRELPSRRHFLAAAAAGAGLYTLESSTKFVTSVARGCESPALGEAEGASPDYVLHCKSRFVGPGTARYK